MKKNLFICTALTSLMFVLPVSQANAGLFDRLKERLQPTVQEEPVVQEVNMDQYSDQAAVLTSTLMKLAPLMKGKSQTGQLSRDLKLDPSSLGLEMGENGIKVGEGLEVSLGGISMDPCIWIACESLKRPIIQRTFILQDQWIWSLVMT